jgi:hypothetical protein
MILSALLYRTQALTQEAVSARYREAQADGEYAEALSRCGAAAASLDSIQGLAVAGGMAASVNELAADTAAQLASALQAVCTDFGGQQFLRVGQGSRRVAITAHVRMSKMLRPAHHQSMCACVTTHTCAWSCRLLPGRASPAVLSQCWRPP